MPNARRIINPVYILMSIYICLTKNQPIQFCFFTQCAHEECCARPMIYSRTFFSFNLISTDNLGLLLPHNNLYADIQIVPLVLDTIHTIMLLSLSLTAVLGTSQRHVHTGGE